jgi:hypothetical protein
MVTSLSQDPADQELEYRIELAPNCSLTPQGARLFVGSLAAATFGLAGFLALRGLWPVLPFAGLEIGLLAWAVRSSGPHACTSGSSSRCWSFWAVPQRWPGRPLTERSSAGLICGAP